MMKALSFQSSSHASCLIFETYVEAKCYSCWLFEIFSVAIRAWFFFKPPVEFFQEMIKICQRSEEYFSNSDKNQDIAVLSNSDSMSISVIEDNRQAWQVLSLIWHRCHHSPQQVQKERTCLKGFWICFHKL